MCAKKCKYGDYIIYLWSISGPDHSIEPQHQNLHQTKYGQEQMGDEDASPGETVDDEKDVGEEKNDI